MKNKACDAEKREKPSTYKEVDQLFGVFGELSGVTGRRWRPLQSLMEVLKAEVAYHNLTQKCISKIEIKIAKDAIR